MFSIFLFADLSDNLVSHYPFNGNANDASGYGYDLIPYNGVDFSVEDRIHSPNSASHLDGVDDYMEGDSYEIVVASGDQNSFCVSFWFKPDTDWQIGSNPDGLVLGNSLIGSFTDWGVFIGNESTLYFWWLYTNPSQLHTTTNFWSQDNWYHVLFNYDSTINTLDVWVNKNLENSNYMTDDIGRNSTNIFNIGKYNLPQECIDSKIDDIRIYDRALTSDEVIELYHEHGYDVLIAEYPFTGDATDQSGNGHDHTVYGAVLSTDRFLSDNCSYWHDGFDDYIISTDLGLTYENETINIWVKGYTDRDGFQEIFFSDTRDEDTCIRFNTDGTVFVRMRGSSTYSTTTSYRDDQWHMYSIVMGSSDFDFYIDGNYEMTESIHADPVDGEIVLGVEGDENGANTPEWFFQGYIDDLSIYNYDLTESEILELYGNYHAEAFYPNNGNANDESGNGHDLTIYEATLSPDRFLTVDKAYEYDGVNDYMYSTDLDLDYLNETINIWAKGNSDRDGIQEILFSDTRDEDTLIRFNTDGTVLVRVRGSATYSTTTAYRDDQWHMFSIVLGDSDFDFYIDGNYEMTESIFSDPVDGEIVLGVEGDENGANTPEWFFEGSIDDILIYNRTLNEAEIEALYEDGGWPFIIADFSASPLAGDLPLVVDFTDLSTGHGTTTTSWVWNFGDGITSTEQNPSHTYWECGLYDVTLITSDGSVTDTLIIEDYIDVNCFPTAANEPQIYRIEDMPDDQGHNVRVYWTRSLIDSSGADPWINFYSIWRRMDDLPRNANSIQVITERELPGYNEKDIVNNRILISGRDEYWEGVGTVGAIHQSWYSYVAPTLIDSNSTDTNYSFFKIYAHTNINTFYESVPDSGYSVDNIPPNPADEVYIAVNGNNIELSWDEVSDGSYSGNSYPEMNGVWYKVYASDDAYFVCDESNLIDTVSDPEYNYSFGADDKMFFKIVVSDQP